MPSYDRVSKQKSCAECPRYWQLDDEDVLVKYVKMVMLILDSAFIMTLKDHFKITGLNGDHWCLVYDVLGPSIATIQLESNWHSSEDAAYLALSSVRKIVYQVLLGLDYMHSVGVVHGDLYPSNVLFAVASLSQQPVEALCQPKNDITCPITRMDGPRQAEDPRHLTWVRHLYELVSHNAEVNLADLGNSDDAVFGHGC